MSEENNGQQAGNQDGSTEFKPITTQEELNRLIGDRINKVKSQFSDYEDLKAKASKLDQAEEANKTEIQKAIDRAEAAEKRAKEADDRVAGAERAALRARIAAETNVPVEVLQGDDEEAVRASAQKILEWRDAGKKPAPQPKQLRSGSSGSADNGQGRAAAALRSLRGGN